jgi:hypothetical protein
MLNYGSRDNWLDIDLLWILEITYGGIVYRFSTITMDLLDSDGISYPYIGGLEDVIISTTLQQVGDISTQADSVSIGITFPNLNIAKEQMNGNLLEGSSCRIGYVLIKNGEIQQSFNERPIVFKGEITAPVYGHPTRDLGYVEFSIENKVFIFPRAIGHSIRG